MNIKNFIFGIAIIILTISVTVYGINTFYPQKQYDNFCDFSRVIPPEINTSNQCESLNGKWVDFGYEGKVEARGYCDVYYKCNQDYENYREKRSLPVFIIAILSGVLVIILGAFVFKLDSVGAGLMGGGVGTILYGVGVYWSYTQNWAKFLISLLGLIILIWFAYWLNKKFSKPEKAKKFLRSLKKKRN